MDSVWIAGGWERAVPSRGRQLRVRRRLEWPELQWCELLPGLDGIVGADGWSDAVCETNKACEGLVLRDPAASLKGGKDSDADESDAVCYKEGYGINEMFQMCDVTSTYLLVLASAAAEHRTQTARSSTCSQIDLRKSPSPAISPRPPAVSSSGSARSSRSIVACRTALRRSTSATTATTPSTIAARWSAPAFLARCSVARTGASVHLGLVVSASLANETRTDISDFLTEEIAGPAKFSSRTGEGSKFEEPAMNQLINDIFGDNYITLSCASGECMHSSEVPGFVVGSFFRL